MWMNWEFEWAYIRTSAALWSITACNLETCLSARLFAHGNHSNACSTLLALLARSTMITRSLSSPFTCSRARMTWIVEFRYPNIRLFKTIVRCPNISKWFSFVKTFLKKWLSFLSSLPLWTRGCTGRCLTRLCWCWRRCWCPSSSAPTSSSSLPSPASADSTLRPISFSPPCHSQTSSSAYSYQVRERHVLSFQKYSWIPL